jgi:hypothetical protein
MFLSIDLLTISKTDKAIEIFPPIGKTLRQSAIADRVPSGSTTDVQRCGLVHCRCGWSAGSGVADRGIARGCLNTPASSSRNAWYL